ncbi:4-aminobutyrate--2-oxoglutarate transaminase [Actinokineospora diospyrosa]|uniref:(S)-3-amino-2-methylpropionate transaminase n=1 Tax=Actinokineospora diospyrosa TaxID=103728 RepID=A0ABT1IBG3_9PSEU|nr:4-aminobutyrate--2-oxoglutarate transaminase [Actinokineospora diospyrosa]MCP2269980.1 4-aminobutyrate aminotransferase / (S)-3-amino-2-methylpropionate transaminase [Actinokineospora diospyrosa]
MDTHPLVARRSAAVASGVSSLLPGHFATSAEPGVLLDQDGTRLIDLGSGIGVTTVGNAAPAVVAAVARQATEFTHACFMVNPYEGYVEVCERLNELTPGSHEKRSALFTSGAEAVENAIKVARHATGRSAVAVFDHAYHGRTNLTLALTAKNRPYKHRFGPFAGEIYRAPMSYPLRDPADMTGQEAAQRAISHLDAQVGADNLAALLIEPIQGEGGYIVPAPGFLPAIADWCRANGIVFIADEVQTGFCRTGTWFASEHEDVVPDLITTAKGIAGGLPLAAVTGRAELMNAVHPGGLGGTYGGNPLACAAALATMDLMLTNDLAAAAIRIFTRVTARLAPRTGPHLAEVRGRGAMIGLEFAAPDSTPSPTTAHAVATRCHEAGVIVLTCGTHNNVIRLIPPLVIPTDLLDHGVSVLCDAIDSLGQV